MLIHDDRITLHNAVDGKIAAVTSIGDLTVFKHLDRNLHSIYSRASDRHDGHCGFSSTVRELAGEGNMICKKTLHALVACLKMDCLVQDAVIAGSSVDEDASNLRLPPTLAAEHFWVRPPRVE